jgi:hypothetical protein
MYLEGKIAVDPEHLTEIKIKKPEKAFKRLLYLMTRGAVGDKKEVETFTAISITQSLCAAMKNVGVNNIIRLYHDKLDYYLDEEGKKDDLEEALRKYDMELDRSMSSVFKNLLLVLEHEDEHFKYLIRLKVNRSHEVGEYPIEISVTGLIRQFQEAGGEEDVKIRMQAVFASQESYNEFQREKNFQFEQFLNDLAFQVKREIEVTDVIIEHETRVVAPGEETPQQRSVTDPAYAGGYNAPYYAYYGFGDFLFYSMLWSGMCHDHHISVSDTNFVSGQGDDIGAVGEEGLDMSETESLSEADFADASMPDAGEAGLMDSAADPGGDSGWSLGSMFDGGGDSGGFDFGGFD